MSHNHHGELVTQLQHKILDLQRGDGIDRAGRLVHEQNLRFGGNRTRDAEPLLLTAGKREPGFFELVLHLVPERGAAERLLDPVGDFAFRELEVQPHRVGDVVEHRHRERRRLLEDHADLAAQFEHIDVAVEDVLPVDPDLPLRALAAIEFKDPVVDAQMGRFAAAGGTDHGRDPVGGDIDGIVEQRLMAAGIIEVEMADRYFNCFVSVHGVSP